VDVSKSNFLCYNFDQTKYPDGPLEFFKSFPILRLMLQDDQGNPFELDWYPSEYFYREHDGKKYCLGVDVQRENEILLGGTFLRQHIATFDVEHMKVGFARASCSDDPYQVMCEADMIAAGQRWALDPTHLESVDIPCDHSRSVAQNTGSYTKTPYTPKEKTAEKQESSFLTILTIIATLAIIGFVGVICYIKRKK